jgi:hypothetical protein
MPGGVRAAGTCLLPTSIHEEEYTVTPLPRTDKRNGDLALAASEISLLDNHGSTQRPECTAHAYLNQRSRTITKRVRFKMSLALGQCRFSIVAGRKAARKSKSTFQFQSVYSVKDLRDDLPRICQETVSALSFL